MLAIFLFGSHFLYPHGSMLEILLPFSYSIVVAFVLWSVSNELGKGDKRKRYEEYQRKLTEWEKQQNQE